jgi:hypothetical protein
MENARTPKPDDRNAERVLEGEISARLEQWTARSCGLANRAVAVVTIISMTAIAAIAAGKPDTGQFLRDASSVFFAGHLLMYVLVRRHLGELRKRGLPAAAAALEAYRDPRRITNLDLAVAWACFFLLAPRLSLI